MTTPPSADTITRILVVGPSWVGDMVMSQAMFAELHRQHANLQLDVLAPAWSAPLLERMPEVHAAIDLPLAHGELGLAKRYALGKRLALNDYHQVILIPNSFKSALIPWFAGISKRTGWRGEMRGWVLSDCRRLSKEQYPLMVQRLVALALPPGAPLPDPLPVPALKVARGSVEATLAEFGLTEQKSAQRLALCPGAEFGSAKQWPVEHYAAVASAAISDGWQVCLFGSAKDQQVTEQIVELLPGGQRASCHDLAGRTSLGQAIDLLSTATAVVSNDSGLMHIAAALHRPLVALYGSTSAAFTPPLSDRVELLHTDIDCRPCFKRECPYGHKRCLTELSPERVLAALTRLRQPLMAI